jgi:predicted ester cyclase
MGTATALVETVWAAIESGDLGRLDQLVSADVELATATGAGSGLDHFKEVFRRHLSVYPDIRHRVVASVESADHTAVALEMEFTATHSGELRTPFGVIAPSGRTLVWRSSDHVRASDGRVVSWRAYFDRMALLEQLGVVVAPTERPAPVSR